MSVEPGFGGQKFIPATPERIAAIRTECDRRGLSTLIEVDGGVNVETGPCAVKPGPTGLMV